VSDPSGHGRFWLEPNRVDFGRHTAADAPVVASVRVCCADARDPQGYYGELGVYPDASFDECRRAFRRRATTLHPDRNPSDPEAEAKFKRLNAAWEVLRDPASRTDYDEAPIRFRYIPQEGPWWTSEIIELDDASALLEVQIEAIFGGGIPDGVHEETVQVEIWGERLSLLLRLELVGSTGAAGSRPADSPRGGPSPSPDGTPSGGGDPRDPRATPVASPPISVDAVRSWFVDLNSRARAVLLGGSVGWLILLIALLGGCNKTVVRTVTLPPVTVTETSVVTTTVESPPSGGTSEPTTTGASQTTTPAGPASGVSLAVLTAHGKIDPVPEIGRVFDFTVDTPIATTLFVTDRSAGGSTCAPTESSDSGAEFLNTDVDAGHHHVRQPFTFGATGPFLFCMWLGSSSDDPSSKVSSTTVVFRQPRGSVSFSSSPSHPRLNQATVLRFVGTTEVPRTLFVAERPAGGASCAPTAGSDTGNTILDPTENGGFNDTYVRTFDAAGTYMYCVWIASDSGDTSPVGGVHRFLLRVG